MTAPTERARELLLACQDRVYNVCFGAKRALEQIRAGETRADRLLTAFRQTK